MANSTGNTAFDEDAAVFDPAIEAKKSPSDAIKAMNKHLRLPSLEGYLIEVNTLRAKMELYPMFVVLYSWRNVR